MNRTDLSDLARWRSGPGNGRSASPKRLWLVLKNTPQNIAFLSLICGAALLAACSKGDAESKSVSAASASPQKEVDRKVFQVRGVVQEVKPSEKEVVIRHEEIPDYMPAMTMPFEVKDTNELTGLAPNDQVAFTMIVTEKEGWIEEIRKVGIDATSIATKERPKSRAVRDVAPLAVGDKMPDYSFTNSLGQKISLSAFKDQASHSLVSAWDGPRLVGLGNAISDGFLVVYYPHLLVLPEYCRRGIGSRIMRLLIERYEKFHQHIIMADGRALDFYRKCGFERAGNTQSMWIYSGNDH